jgi:Tol biopolymer transport system component
MDTDSMLLDTRSGDMRRIPYCLGVSHSGCFSKDRRSVFVSGQDSQAATIGLFQIDLATGRERRLGERALTRAAMFPTLSPDGKTIAVLHMFGNFSDASALLNFQIYLVDVTSGDATPLGEPLDTAYLSWLPDGSGIVLVTRRNVDLESPSIDTVARMDLQGRITPICNGTNPVVLNPYRRILYSDQTDNSWNICDLSGKHIAVLGDGMKDYNSPTASPDGRRLVMMRIDESVGPRPYVIDIATGNADPIAVDQGLWVVPAWR